MTKLIDLTNNEIDFLKDLGGKLRSVKILNDPQKGKFASETFSERNLTEKELSRIIKISKKNNVVFYPTMTQYGFSTAFGISKVDVIAPGVDPNVELLTVFREDQLPEGYNFEKLSEYFMEEMNLRTAKVAGIKITDNLVDYVY